MFRAKIKKSFTIIELVLVVVLISLVYGIFFANIKKVSTQDEDKNKNILNLKSLLLQYDFEETIEIKCTDVDFKCFVLSDGEVVGELKEKLFDAIPTVYSYERNGKKITYNDLKMEQLERYSVYFHYKIDKYGKTKDMILEANEKIYIFNSIFNKPIIVENLSEVGKYFESGKEKVKDVF